MWSFLPHQELESKRIAADLMIDKWHYMVWEERTGKSGTALKACMRAGFKNVMVITKKNAIDGWLEHTDKLDLEGMNVTITNYHQIGTMKIVKRKRRITLKVDRDDYDAVIIDESHAYISAGPKPSNMFYVVRTFVADKPTLYLSATPHAQGYHLLYHQFKVSRYTPWQNYVNFYDWWRVYGIENKQYIGPGQERETYTVIDEAMVLADLDGHFSYKTRAEVGIEHEPNDVIHYIELDPNTKEIYNVLQRDKVVTINDVEIVADSVMKERTTLHMLESGCFIEHQTVLDKNDEPKDVRIYHTTDNIEKIAYIKKVWGDKSNVVIMYNYKAEKIKLEQHFVNAKLSQATSNAEGVDYSMYDHLIILSQDFSTSRHSQRRARQANIKRDTPIDVHFLLVKDGISDQVYKTVSINKENFVDKNYNRLAL